MKNIITDDKSSVVISNSAFAVLITALIIIGAALVAEKIRYGLLLLLIGLLLLFKMFSKKEVEVKNKDKKLSQVREDGKVWRD